MQSLGVCGGNNNRRREACQCPLVALKALVCTDVLPPGVSLTLRQGLLLGSEAQPWLHLATTKREADRLLREHIRAAGGTASGVFLVRAKKLEESQFVLDVAWVDEESGLVEVECHLISRSQTQGYVACRDVGSCYALTAFSHHC